MKDNSFSIHSIRSKLSILTALAIIITGFMMILIYSPNVKSEISSMSQNYLMDLSTSYGKVIDSEIENKGVKRALVGEELNKHLNGV